MRTLWLTFHDPDPAINGQYLYSSGLISSARAAGLDLDVVALARTDGLHRDGVDGSVTWHLAPGGERSSWSSLFSSLPHVAFRSATRPMKKRVARLLTENRYDVVVFDSICVGWALYDPKLVRDGTGPRLVHIAHNREHEVAASMAVEEPHPLRRSLKRLEAAKVRRLERDLFETCELNTSNTPEDREAFQAEHPHRRVDLLRPGYVGPRRAYRAIGEDTPARVIIVGSFNWPPKRISLEQFLHCALPLFSGHGVSLQVVGHADAEFLDAMRLRFPAVEFTGRVDDVHAYLADARIAIVPDTLGGFKLKSLDYVFSRVPIFGLAGAVPGLPLRDGLGVRLFRNHAALALGVADSIGNFAALNRQHELAYCACQNAFGWDAIGRELVSAIKSLPLRSACPAVARSAAQAVFQSRQMRSLMRSAVSSVSSAGKNMKL